MANCKVGKALIMRILLVVLVSIAVVSVESRASVAHSVLDSTDVPSDSTSLPKTADSTRASMRIYFSLNQLGGMLVYKVINGKDGDLFRWEMGYDIKVFPMITVGASFLVSSETKNVYQSDYVPPAGFIERRVSSSTTSYMIVSLGANWYLSGQAYTNSFVLGLEGNYRSISEPVRVQVSPLSIGATIGYRWFYSDGFMVESTIGVDSYGGQDASQMKMFGRVNLGYSF
jgi:hypothetical protein